MGDGVLLLGDRAMIEHDPGPGNPERPARLRAIHDRIEGEPINGTAWRAPKPAPRAALERVHRPAYVDAIDSLRGRTARLCADTAVCPASVPAAYLAAGAAIEAAAAVVAGGARRAFALVRPPGHHAEADEAMGFCLFNNIAVAAAHAVSELGCRRVLVVDWDVHHGNGTQHAFLDRADVLFFSTHRYPFYPGTGTRDEVGVGSGAGFTVNVPLPPGLGDAEHLAIYRRLLVPVADAYAPDLVLVSAGFDSHRDDLLGDMAVTEEGFAALCALVQDIAERHAQGRVALILEGGYDLTALADSVHRCIEILAGSRPGMPAEEVPGAAARIIDAVRAVHETHWPL